VALAPRRAHHEGVFQMESFARYFLILLLSSFAGLAQGLSNNGSRILHVDAGKIVGNIHSF
jgi:hypothetical protein